MRLIKGEEGSRQLRALLPSAIASPHPDWNTIRSYNGFQVDLGHGRLTSASGLTILPEVLRRFDEERCLVFNHELVLAKKIEDDACVGIEIKRDTPSSVIEYELSNDGENHIQFLSVFYVSGDFGILSEAGDWLVFASENELAFFASADWQKYASFNEVWWSSQIGQR